MRSKPKGKKNNRGEKREFDKKIVSIRRVTRVNKGGKRMRLSVCLVVGDRKGRVGLGIGKGADVRTAEEKAFNFAVKHLFTIPLNKNTIPHEIVFKRGAAKIFMKPAAPGTGVVAGSSLRAVLELVGVKDILTKVIGTNNPISNAYATLEALQGMKSNKKIEVVSTKLVSPEIAVNE
ncbi:30S ribosomal protein S5 [Candidatus Dojkabacteria bacterium]|nr:30S ribosomal protein S5 [Candidatus Dojkabacteria bacterium]